MGLLALRRIVDHPVGSQQGPRTGAGHAEGIALPEHLPLLVDHPRCVDHRARRKVAKAAGKPERDDAVLRNAVLRAEADQLGA